MLRLAIVATCVLFILAPTANGATTKQLQREVKSLKAQLKTAKRQRDTYKARLATANQENQDLKGGVPDQVRAIAREDDIAQLFNLVIVPAHDVWPCGGSLFYGETFDSADFDKHTSDGGCY
jgi:septal ring factor EnvC (AmiA/AmiB activator)